MLGNSKQIAELQEKVTSLQSQLDTATGDKSKLEAELAKANADLQAAIAKGTSLETDVAKLKADLEAANGKVTAAEKRATDAEASIEARVTERLASAGVDPIKRDPSASASESGKKAPDASLPPRQRAAAAMGEWSVFKK